MYTCITNYTNILTMVTIAVTPGIRVTVINACFITRTSNIVQPDGTIARSIVSIGAWLSTRAENNVKIDLKINGLVACGSNPVRTFAGLT
jgi:hypothetical protein